MIITNKMKVPIVRIGNSKGIRLSKTILEKYNFKDAVDLIMEKGHLLIRPLPESRSGWEEAFKIMGENKDDELLIEDVLGDENFDEWK